MTLYLMYQARVSHLKPELTSSASLSIQLAPGIPFSPVCWDYRQAEKHLHRLWGSELRSSLLCKKHFHYLNHLPSPLIMTVNHYRTSHCMYVPSLLVVVVGLFLRPSPNFPTLRSTPNANTSLSDCHGITGSFLSVFKVAGVLKEKPGSPREGGRQNI